MIWTVIEKIEMTWETLWLNHRNLSTVEIRRTKIVQNSSLLHKKLHRGPLYVDREKEFIRRKRCIHITIQNSNRIIPVDLFVSILFDCSKAYECSMFIHDTSNTISMIIAIVYWVEYYEGRSTCNAQTQCIANKCFCCIWLPLSVFSILLRLWLQPIFMREKQNQSSYHFIRLGLYELNGLSRQLTNVWTIAICN